MCLCTAQQIENSLYIHLYLTSSTYKEKRGSALQCTVFSLWEKTCGVYFIRSQTWVHRRVHTVRRLPGNFSGKQSHAAISTPKKSVIKQTLQARSEFVLPSCKTASHHTPSSSWEVLVHADGTGKSR